MKLKKLFGKILGAGLCLGMILGLMPSQALQVFAEGASTPNYLTFTAEEANSTVSLTWYAGENVQYSTDRGVNWVDYGKDMKLTLNNIGDTVSFKGKNVVINDAKGYGYGPGFTMTGKIGAFGSVTSLLDENGGDSNVQVPAQGFAGLFRGCESLTSAPELPALNLSERCYSYMFTNCTNLQTTPQLPATKLATYCYGYMFMGCTSLVGAPELPAMTMVNGCYNKMFSGCTSLATAPKLPATRMANYCYGQMFESCTSLKTIPDLPATSLVSECYWTMFNGCTGISLSQQKDATHTLAWVFPNVTGTSWGGNMFSGCDVDFGNNSAYPQINTTYYQLCTHSYGADKKCIYCGEEEQENSDGDSITPNYLTFTAEEAGSTLSFTWDTGSEVKISTDHGNTWSSYTKGKNLKLENVNDSVQFRGKVTRLNEGFNIIPAFIMTGKIAASGSVTSLLDDNGGDSSTKIGASGLAGLFKNCASLTQAPELPSTSVSNNGYLHMFENCTSLVEAPKLPATTLGYDAYTSMFSGCTNMKTGPSTLPATALNIACYSNMFRDCKSLIKAPELPAMTMTQECYRSMFQGCTSLQQIPNLPATKLALGCYANMFENCKSLSMTSSKDSSHTIAWILPSATLPSSSPYVPDWNAYMFQGCTNVNIGTPQLNKTYYQLCRHSYNENDICIYCGEAKPKTYSVTLIAGEGLTRHPYYGAEQQTNLLGAMEQVYYTADEDYYIQDDYPKITENGITVARYVLAGWGPVIIVNGTPTADTTITLPAALARNVTPNPEPNPKPTPNPEPNPEPEPNPNPTPAPTPEKPIMKDGDNGEHVIGKAETLTFRSSAPLSEFVAVWVDGVKVNPSNYDVFEGSTIVRLKQSFLDTLSKGSHTIAIQSRGGTAAANFTITASSNSGNTGAGGTTGGTTPSTPTAGITNVQPNGGTQTAQKTTVNAKAPITGEASPVSCMVLAFIIVGGFALLIVELRRSRQTQKKR